MISLATFVPPFVFKHIIGKLRKLSYNTRNYHGKVEAPFSVGEI